MNQLLVMVTPRWNSVQGRLSLYERENLDKPWLLTGETIPVVVGQAGMAWGRGLHQSQEELLCKKEGDRKSPAGIFALGPAFGHAPSMSLQMDYISITPSTEAVDDPKSRYYNQIVKREEIVQPDWTSSEKMAEISLYELGAVIQHNFPQPLFAAGSAIFLHIWRSAQSGTGGCTAMSRENLFRILEWLDREKSPRLVQLPADQYEDLKKEWDLPDLSSN